MQSLLLLAVVAMLGDSETAPTSEAAKAAPDEGQMLEQLLDINVNVATRSSQKLSKAPGVITAYRAADIERLGYYTLGDLADITPGYTTNIVWGERIYTTRGQRSDQFENNKHLLVVDGIPVNFARDYKSFNGEEMPLFFAQQVEFLRGPASAVYGTSAFLGVVNVVPKELERPGILTETRAAYGSYDNDIQVNMNLLARGDHSVSRLSAAFYRKRASQSFVHPTGAPRDGAFLFWDDKNDLFINGSHRWTEGPLAGLSPGFFVIRENGGLGESWYGTFSNEVNDISFESFIPYLKYTRDIAKDLQLYAYAKVHLSREKGWHAPVKLSTKDAPSTYLTGPEFEAYEINVVDTEVLAQVTWNPLEFLTFVGGLDYDVRWSLGNGQGSYIYEFAPPANPPGDVQATIATVGSGTKFNTASVFLQAQGHFDWLAGTNITLGVRNDNGSVGARWYTHWSPRVGVVQQFTDWLGLKLLYNTSLRAPAIKEVGRNIEARSQGENPPSLLLPEAMTSFEGSLTFNVPHFTGSVTGFYNEVTDVLANQKHPGFNDEYFENIAGKSPGKGIEVDARYVLSEALDVFANYSFAYSRTPRNLWVQDVPTHWGNAGISSVLPIPFDLRLTGVVRYINAWQANGERPKGWTVVDVKAGSKVIKDLLVELQVRNLLGMDYRRPQNGVGLIPGAGRTFLVALQWQI